MVQKKDNLTENSSDKEFNTLYWVLLLFLLIQIAIYYQLTTSLK